MKILVTAFEPFNHEEKNSSLEVLSLLKDKDIETEVLPVTYSGCVKKLVDEINKIHPDFVLSLGQYGGSNTIRVEKVGLNYTRASIPDNAGVLLQKGEVKKNGKEAIFTTLECEDLVSELNQTIPTVLSLSAGGFICNSTYYTALDQMQGKALFVHLPYFEGQGDKLIPTMKKEVMVQAVEFVLQFIKNTFTVR